jgi:hypothetical protein
MTFPVIDSAPLHAAFVWNGAFTNPIAVAGSGNDKPGKDQASDKKEDKLVITPGGPRAPEQVHPVGPGEVVRRNPDGTYSVVPDPTGGGNKETPPKK